MGNCESYNESVSKSSKRKEQFQNNNQNNQINKNISKPIIIPSKPIPNTNFKFMLSTGEKFLFSANENTTFRQIFIEFVNSKCPLNHRKNIKAVLHNAEKVDFNKTAKENKIREGSIVLVIIMEDTQNNTVQNNISQNQNLNNFNNNYTINIIPIILANINIIKNIRPKNMHELKEKIEKFYAFYINDYRVQNDIIINLIQDRNVLAQNIQQYYNSRIRGFEFSKNLLMESHYKEYNKNKGYSENDFYMPNISLEDYSYNRREIENDMKENYKDFREEKKSIMDEFNRKAKELIVDRDNELEDERRNYFAERLEIMNNSDYNSWERRKELNELEKEHKNRIKEIKEDYNQSLKWIKEDKNFDLRNNENNYEERQKMLNNKQRDNDDILNLSINIQNANNEFNNNLEMLIINLTNEINNLDKEFNEQLNRLKIFYSQNNMR